MTDVARVQRSSRESPRRRLLRRFSRSANVLIGASVLLFMIVLGVSAPILTSYNPEQMTAALRLRPPDAEHLFGTDDFGRDVFTRIAYGARLSLLVGVISVSIASTIGVTLGIVAGYFGGWIDALIMRLIDVMLAFPGILLALVIVSILGRSLTNVMIAVGISSIPAYARMARGTTLALKSVDYITAARAIGAPTARMMRLHILPNITAPLIIVATNGVAGAIIAGAALSFLGLGAQPPTPEWGIMLAEGRVYLRNAWWVTTFPGLAIMVTVMAINLMGDGLRDILDPRLRL
ncbi:MAG: ABC transporter permease [Chloroflexota bacterium]|nr:ABC transporter permease [Chloroflexota bacterium]